MKLQSEDTQISRHRNPEKLPRMAVVVVSQMMILRSKLALTMRVPPAVKLTAVTSCLCATYAASASTRWTQPPFPFPRCMPHPPPLPIPTSSKAPSGCGFRSPPTVPLERSAPLFSSARRVGASASPPPPSRDARMLQRWNAQCPDFRDLEVIRAAGWGMRDPLILRPPHVRRSRPSVDHASRLTW
eukprot:scaffold895_cov315-Pinguiococcus_pyrenoidosus.AAC.10